MDDDHGPDDLGTRTADGAAANHWPVLAVTAAALALPLVVVLVVVAAVIPGIPWWAGVPLGLAVAVAVVALRFRGAYDRVLGTLGVSAATPGDHARYHNLAQGLSLAGGVAEPDLFVIDDPARNAAAVARGGASAIVATTGLLDAIDRIGLEAVVAECLVRIGNGDAEAATIGAALFGPLVSSPARPLGAYGLRRLLAEDRDLLADRGAVALTRYPPGLLAALNIISAGSPRVGNVPDHYDHMWLVPPPSIETSGSIPIETPPLTLRIDVLGEL